jgi:hemolysin D
MVWRSLSRHLTVWRAAWRDETVNALGTAPNGRAVEFLPAVLEIQHAPPSPIGRAIGWTIMAVFVSAVVWAIFGQLDMVAVAQGKIIPSGYSKVIQPLESGVITAIHVRDGQFVKRGDVLIDLNTTVNDADQERVVNEHRAAKIDALRLRTLIAGGNAFAPPDDVNPQYVALQQQRLRDQFAEFDAKVEAAKRIHRSTQGCVGRDEGKYYAIKGDGAHREGARRDV